MDGWIKLHRQIREHFLWNGEKFSKGQAWVDMLLRANHKDAQVIFRDEVISINRGSFITSELKLAANWKWSRGKVRRFLDELKIHEMCYIKRDKRKTAITICKYYTYQKEGFGNSTSDSTSDGTTESQQKDINKNVNKKKNEKKKIYGGFKHVRLTDKEHEKLKADYSENKLNVMIKNLDEYIEMTGKVYKNHSLTMRKWEEKNIGKGNVYIEKGKKYGID